MKQRKLERQEKLNRFLYREVARLNDAIGALSAARPVEPLADAFRIDDPRFRPSRPDDEAPAPACSGEAAPSGDARPGPEAGESLPDFVGRAIDGPRERGRIGGLARPNFLKLLERGALDAVEDALVDLFAVQNGKRDDAIGVLVEMGRGEPDSRPVAPVVHIDAFRAHCGLLDARRRAREWVERLRREIEAPASRDQAPDAGGAA